MKAIVSESGVSIVLRLIFPGVHRGDKMLPAGGRFGWPFGRWRAMKDAEGGWQPMA